MSVAKTSPISPLDPTAAEPFYRQIYKRFRRAIASGLLKPGERIPPARALAQELGGRALVDIVLEHSHTCYLGERGRRHDWGYGCGTCPACELRARGWAEWTAAA